jgi:3-oxoacyl-[acyl-carrier protein] reductase
MFCLKDKKALVTGATGGIGAEIARALHGRGATVVLSGTRQEKLEGLAHDLGERVDILACDLSQPEETEDLIGRAEQTLGGA